MKILVVDDDAVCRGTVSALLTKSGHIALEAESGESALATVQSANRLDLVLMDINMPGMGGIAAGNKIRALPGWRGQLPVIFMSSSDPPERILATVDGFVGKGKLDSLDDAMADGITQAKARIDYDAQVLRTAPGMGKQVWDSLPRVLVIITCLGILYKVVTWSVGDVRPQSQIDIAQNKQDLADFRERTAEHFVDVRNLVGQCGARVDAMQPLILRDGENRTSHLEAHYDDLSGRIYQTEAKAADALARLDRLTVVPPRGSR
jgi:CheY-like chemotaxis protein